MYAAVACRHCKKYRIIDRSSLSSKCPFCGENCEHSSLQILFEDRDQAVVRNAIASMTGFVPEPKTRTSDADPFSTLVHRYEKCSEIDEKMRVLSEGLTAILGTFTLEDVESVDPKNAKQLLRAMLELCLIHEVKYGVYKA
jgi:hypothetical protein